MGYSKEEIKQVIDQKLIDNINEEIEPEDLRLVLGVIVDSMPTEGESLGVHTTSKDFFIPAGEKLDGLSAAAVIKKYSTRGFRQVSVSIDGFPLLEKGKANAILVKGTIALGDVQANQLSISLLRKNNAPFASFSTLNFSYSDSIEATTNYWLGLDVNMPDGSIVGVTATREAKCVAPTLHGVSPDEFVLEAEAKEATKLVVEQSGSRQVTFYANNAHAFLFEPKSFGLRNRIMDQNNFEVTKRFTVIERTFTLKENTNPEGQPSNAITEQYYGYIKKTPAGNGSAFTYTFHNS